MFSEAEVGYFGLNLQNTSAERLQKKKKKKKPIRRKRMTRSHCEDLKYKTLRGPEENSDNESYQP